MDICRRFVKSVITTLEGTLFVFVLGYSGTVFGQDPLLKEWDHRFGGTNDDQFYTLIQTNDGGYLLGGYSLSDRDGDKSEMSRGGNDYWIVKTDASGNKLWDKRYGGNLDDRLYSMAQTPDGGYILAGYSNSDNFGDVTEPCKGGFDYWLIKIDAVGNKTWDKRLGGGTDEKFPTVCLTAGGYILGGSSYSGVGGDKTQPSRGSWDYWIIKTDLLGNRIWDVDLGGDNLDQLHSFCATADGGYLLGGFSFSGLSGEKTQPSVGDADFWIVKIDSVGTKLWDSDFGGTDKEILCSVSLTSDGGFICGGYSNSGISGDKTENTRGLNDYWIVKTDANGFKLWDRDFGGIDQEDNFGNVFQTREGGFFLSGTSYSTASGDKSENNLGIEQVWVIKTDASGLKEWDKTILTPGEDELCYSIQNDDRSFVIGETANGAIGGFKTESNRDTANIVWDYWLIKFRDSTEKVNMVTQFNTSLASICPGTCTSFDNFSLNADHQLWLFPGATPSTSTDRSPAQVCYAMPGFYNVTLINYNSFGSDTLIRLGFINVFQEAVAPQLSQSGDTLIAPTGYQTYQWYYNSNLLVGANSNSLYVTQDGDYSVIVTDNNGCEAGAGIIQVTTSIHKLNQNVGSIGVFPNPSAGTFTVNANSNLKLQHLRIKDALGQEIYNEEINEVGIISKEIRLHATPGIYFIHLSNSDQDLSAPLIIY